MKTPRRLVLFSGGLDSTVLLAWALQDGPAATLTFDYPGRPVLERQAARRILDHYDVRERLEATLPTTNDTAVRGRETRGHIPGRNLYYYATAALAARARAIPRVTGGQVATDRQDFADASPTFFRTMERLANADRGPHAPPVKIETPFLRLGKGRVVRLGADLGAPIELSWSCYINGPSACGSCNGCRGRARAFADAKPGPAKARKRTR